MAQFKITVENGSVKINGVDDLDKIWVLQDKLSFAQIRSLSTDQIKDVKASLSNLLEAFYDSTLSQELTKLIPDDAAATVDGSQYALALGKLLSWKKQIIKEYVYVAVLERTGEGEVDADEDSQKIYDKLKEFMTESVRILLNIGALDQDA